jgi:dihydroorotate dehydrogenase
VGLYKSILRPLAFQVDPEAAHNLAMSFLEKGLISAHRFENPALRQILFGVEFANPIGLAAGFDKNALAVSHWHRLGFGYVECGTVTWHPQPGNPQPRMFRLPEDQAVINRMGFNNHGAKLVAERLKSAHPKIPVGVNLGKSKITELPDAPQDYAQSFRELQNYGDYFVVNVSSPNTPGLRGLQERGPLLEIIRAIQEIDRTKPLFVKIAPDLEWDAVDDVIAVAQETSLTGIIAVNTTIARTGIRRDPNQAGGLSGKPLRDRALAVLRHLKANCGPECVLIGVGGIMDGDDAYERLRAGAHLIQLYTGWIYGGPNTVPEMLRRIAERMQQDGVSTLAGLRALN